MSILWGFIYGLVGGISTEILALYKLRAHGKLPNYLSLKRYWIITALMIVMGGILVCAHMQSGDVKLNPLAAINIGASAPLIIGRLSQEALPEEPGSKID